MDNEYELRYLPLFYEDMYEKVTYIREKLLNPEAADTLSPTEETTVAAASIAASALFIAFSFIRSWTPFY